MKLESSRSGRSAAFLLPWLVAAAGLALAAFSWLRPAEIVTAAPGSPEESAQLGTMRLALSTSQAENQVLRRELDRMLSTARDGRRTGGQSRVDGYGKSDANSRGDGQEMLAKNLREWLARAATGDEAARAEATRAIFDLLRGGAEAFSSLRDVYLNAGDAKSRQILLGSMIFSGSPEARDFVLDQVQTEKDPEMRRALMGQAARYATPDVVGGLKTTFIQAVDSPGDDPQTRIAAVRGLRYALGGDAGSALQRAAADPSEEIRIAALDVIASRPGSEQLLRDLISRDPSPRVREIGQCRLLISQTIR